MVNEFLRTRKTDRKSQRPITERERNCLFNRCRRKRKLADTFMPVLIRYVSRYYRMYILSQSYSLIVQLPKVFLWNRPFYAVTCNQTSELQNFVTIWLPHHATHFEGNSESSSFYIEKQCMPRQMVAHTNRCQIDCVRRTLILNV